MTTMNISLPDDLKAFIVDRVAQEGYASASEYLRHLLREAQRRKAKLDLEAKLAEGLQGAPTRMTRKDWQAIEREAQETGAEGDRRHTPADRPLRSGAATREADVARPLGKVGF
jgi:antitoxin ParD1/3/4